MHLAAAAGVAVTAVFGPTDDKATHPPWRRPRDPDASGVVPALHAARVPARSSVHARRRRPGGARVGAKDAVKPAVFLDRDGTLIEDVGYLDSLSRVAFYPWTVDAIRMLNRAGLPVVVVTNQSGVARGMFDVALVDETHRAIDARLAAGGARVDAYYYCPHHPDGPVAAYARSCDCRKPGRGMIDQATARSRPRSGSVLRRRRHVDRRAAGSGGRCAIDSRADRQGARTGEGAGSRRGSRRGGG